MAKQFQLIDIIDESSKVTRGTMDGLFESLEKKEQEVRETLGIRQHFMNEMGFDFDRGSDPGEDEYDFRNAAGQGEFDDEDYDKDDDMEDDGYEDDATSEENMGDMNGIEDEEFMAPKLSRNLDDVNTGRKGPRLGNMDRSIDLKRHQRMRNNRDKRFSMGNMKIEGESHNMYGALKKPGHDFTKHPSDKKGKKSVGTIKKTNETLLQIIARQVNESGGNAKAPKRITPKHNDFVIFEKSDQYGIGVISKVEKRSLKVKINENDSVKVTRVISALKSPNKELRDRAKDFKSEHSERNLWISSL